MKSLATILCIGCAFLSCLTCFGQFGVEQPFFLSSAVGADITRYPQQTNLAGFFDTKSSDYTIRSNNIVTNWVNLASASNPATNTVAKGATWVASGGAGGYGYVQFSKTSPATDLVWQPTNGAPTLEKQKTPITVALVMFFSATNEIMSVFDTYNGVGNPYPGMMMARGYSTQTNGLLAWQGSPVAAALSVNTKKFPPVNEHLRIVAVLGLPQQMLWTNGVLAATNSADAESVYGKCHLGIGGLYGLKGGMNRFIFWRGALSSNECVQVDTQLKSDFGL